MTRPQLVGIVAAAVLSTVLAVGAGAWFMSGDDGRSQRASDRRPRTEVAEGRSKAQKAAPRAPLAAKGKAQQPRGPGAAARTAKRPPQRTREGKSPEAIASQREEGLARRTAMLEKYAADHAWDVAQTEEVGTLLTDSTDYVVGTLARAQEGEPIAELRAEIRTYRTQQAEALKGLVGEEEFPQFVADMKMERFFGMGQTAARGGQAGRAKAGGPRGRRG